MAIAARRRRRGSLPLDAYDRDAGERSRLRFKNAAVTTGKKSKDGRTIIRENVGGF